MGALSEFFFWSNTIKPNLSNDRPPRLVTAVLLSAMAGGMGWGIRGQYGHETGAMIAGALIGFALVLLFFPRLTSLGAARAVALMVLGVSLGGSMTYGQTLGLTHNPALVGNWPALGWGMLGVFIKGGIWIGLAGAFLGMGVSGKRYRPVEGFFLLLGLIVLLVAGIWLLNRPFDPAQRLLPRIYFSASWHWEPTAMQLKPRPECWGGLLLAWLGLSGYLWGVRRDRLAASLAAVGFLAGGVGFALGQSVQAAHAWRPDWFRWGPLAALEPHINWWNLMEITFGATFAAVLACALWRYQRRGKRLAGDDETDLQVKSDDVTVSPVGDGLLLSVYAILLAAAEFSGNALAEPFLQSGLVMGLLPVIAVLGGRYGPYFYALPIVVLPIAGKTLRELAYRNAEFPLLPAWLLLFILPLAVTVAAAWWLARRGQQGQSGAEYARIGLVLSVFLYWGLNLVFFRFAWPWQPWTTRTPSGLFFTICALALILAAIRRKR